MSALMEAQPIRQEYPPAGRFMQDYSFSAKQVTAEETAEPARRFGAFIEPQELPPPSSTAKELNPRFVITTNRREALRFIEDNDLLPILLQSEKHLCAAFGDSPIKTLAIVEDDEGYRTLFCLVMFAGRLNDARNALKSFDDGWWLYRANRFATKLNFDFELV